MTVRQVPEDGTEAPVEEELAAALAGTAEQLAGLGAADRPGTVEIIRRLLAGAFPAVPNIGWNVVDVRDVAEPHISR